MSLKSQNLLSKSKALEIQQTIDIVRNISQAKNQKSRRRIRSIQGQESSIRSYVVIRSSSSASDYTGDVLEGPAGSVIETGVSIRVNEATANPYENGKGAFADKVTENGADVYYIEGYLLG